MQSNIPNIPFYSILTKGSTTVSLSWTNFRIKNICKNIKREKVKLKGFSPLAQKLGQSQSKHLTNFSNKQYNAVQVNNDCILCTKCITCCPTNNLEIRNDKVHQKHKCTFCMRCVNICSKKSITVLFHSKVKFQHIIND